MIERRKRDLNMGGAEEGEAPESVDDGRGAAETREGGFAEETATARVVGRGLLGAARRVGITVGGGDAAPSPEAEGRGRAAACCYIRLNWSFVCAPPIFRWKLEVTTLAHHAGLDLVGLQSGKPTSTSSALIRGIRRRREEKVGGRSIPRRRREEKVGGKSALALPIVAPHDHLVARAPVDEAVRAGGLHLHPLEASFLLCCFAVFRRRGGGREIGLWSEGAGAEEGGAGAGAGRNE